MTQRDMYLIGASWKVVYLRGPKTNPRTGYKMAVQLSFSS